MNVLIVPAWGHGHVNPMLPLATALVEQGLRRLGISSTGRRYFAVHATLDIKHAAAWNAEVIVPLGEAEPRNARPIAEGALMRLAAGGRSFAAYRRELGVCDRKYRSKCGTMYVSFTAFCRAEVARRYSRKAAGAK